jgi:tRNA (cmo5U34)-methyltransferase
VSARDPDGGWSDRSRVAECVSREIPFRELAETMLLDALAPYVGRILDLGTGGGRLAALIRDQFPGCEAVALDSSEPMLDAARRRFEGDERVRVRHHDLARPLSERGPFDAVVSGLAIHHLEHARKRVLFGEVRALLPPGGVFANLDLVRAATPERDRQFRQAIGRSQDDPADRLAGIREQLDWLHDAGFRSIECPFKWMQLTLVVAIR